MYLTKFVSWLHGSVSVLENKNLFWEPTSLCNYFDYDVSNLQVLEPA